MHQTHSRLSNITGTGFFLREIVRTIETKEPGVSMPVAF